MDPLPPTLWFLGGLAGLALGRAAVHLAFRAPRLAETDCPADHGLAGGPVALPTLRGRTLRGFYIPPADTPGPAFCMIHGWGANASVMLPLAARLHGHDGRAVLLLAARNHGDSDADTFSSMPRFAEDLAAGLDWLKQRPEVDPGRLTVAGHSVGAAAALLCASRRDDVAGVVALSPFAHPNLVMRAYMERGHIPWTPIGRLISRYVEHIIGHRFDDIAPVATVRRIAAPVLIVHGRDDTVVPPWHAERIAENGPTARLVVLPGVDHYATDDLTPVADAIRAFPVGPAS
ncbi:alpha/beta hydrolase [Roseospirillum parvum]|uniref:Prolyl oligopeptidase family protein n=1 Tax=Roseospirillum parvum TaxID=83401 RepID=A0A1G7U6N7_9PROT|nr:alpha/beta fold hydrolase [Roseospirillum parvum]SDG42420.1 Prolyl oligopeptidase family protein [Roseospirillum parvum]